MREFGTSLVDELANLILKQNMKLITEKRLKIYLKHDGDTDMFEYNATEQEMVELYGEVWKQIESFIQDINLIKKGLVSKDYENRVNEKIYNLCDSVHTIELLYEIAYAK